MAFTLGSLAVMSGFRPLEPSRVFALFELRSMFFCVVTFFALIVLAYLTNPSEASFRAFLTEQAFRHHLSRLDDSDAQDESESSNAVAKTDALLRRGLSSSFKPRAVTTYSSPSFPFASRASVSLRTPKHIFRSFGVLSVAAVVPTSLSNRSSSARRQSRDEISTRSDKESGSSPHSSIPDSWFIGAFGKWFWTFNLDNVWRDAGFIAEDEVDGAIAGVLGIKALDRSDEHNRIQYTSYNNASAAQGQRTSPKLRSRERFANGNGINHRSQTPPPLPKSASLPLHTKRGSHVSSSEKSPSGRSHQATASLAPSSIPSTSNLVPISITPDFRPYNASAPPAIVPSATPSATPSRSPSALFASSPLIAELLRQISASQNAITDLSSQLTDFDSSSASTRTALYDELERQRERKRADDAAKAELKAQTRTLEEQKRTAESSRRDAERHLRAVQAEQDGADARIECYEQEICSFTSQMRSCDAAIVTSGEDTSAAVADLEQQIEAKKSEVRTVEDEVAQLSLRLREMEDKVACEEQRLKGAVADAEERKSKYMQLQATSPTVPEALSFTGGPDPGSPGNASSLDVQAYHTSHRTHIGSSSLDTSFMNGFSILSSPFDPRVQRRGSLSQRFAPFSSELTSPGPLSPTGESLIPSSLYEPLGMAVLNEAPANAPDMSVSRSFQSEDDMILDRNWLSRRNSTAGDVGRTTFPSPNSGADGSPVSPARSAHAHGAFDSFNVDRSFRERSTSLRFDAQRASFSASRPATDVPPTPIFASMRPTVRSDYVEPSFDVSTRRSGWFTSHKDKGAKIQEKKGLNPDAKEFSLSKDKERSFSAFLSRSRNSGSGHHSGSGSSSTPSSASLSTPEPSSLGNSPALSSATIPKSTSPQAPARTAASFLSLGSSWFGSSRAFAPTPLEREQLSRALGGAANSSFEKLERLPSLPTSPQPKHAPAHNQLVTSLPPRPWETGMPFGMGATGSKTSSSFCPFGDEGPSEKERRT